MVKNRKIISKILRHNQSNIFSCIYCTKTVVFGLTFRLLVLREYSYLGVYLSAVTIWSLPFVISFMLLMPRYALT